MDQIKSSIQNGPPPHENLPPPLLLINNQNSVDVIETKKQSSDEILEPEIDDVAPSEPPARGLELMYKVAEELATRIADEKRYEGIIKPCSVRILRISDVSKYRVIRDPEMIKQEKMTDEESNNHHEDMQIDCYDSSDDEEEMIVPPAEKDLEKSSQLNEETISFFCIFCHEKNIQGKSSAFDHYQSHMDYYPFKCTQCLEVTTNLKNLFIHYRKDHSEEKTATFKKRLMPWITEWIDDFLKSQVSTSRGRFAQPRPYCPVCESSEKKEDIILLPPNLIQPRKHLMHVYKHLCYEPYVCGICQKAGKKFTITDFDDRAYEHILKNHPEAENELLAKVFLKSRYIKPLEGYIIHYLTSAGVSTKRRVPEKIPNFARNKFKAKHESKEKQNTDKDNNRSTTLGDLFNQSSSSLNNQSDTSFQVIGQKSDNLTNLTNQTKANPNVTATPHQMSKTPPIIHKPATMLTTSNSLLLSPSKGPFPQFTTLGINNLPISNCYTVSKISILPKNGVNSTQPIYLPSYQQPNVIQLPCGQLMVRNNNNPPSTPVLVPTCTSTTTATTSTIIPTQNKLFHQSNGIVSLLASPPSILRRPSISPPKQDSLNQNGPFQIQVSPDIGSFIGNDIQNKLKKNDEFEKRRYFCMFCKEMIQFDSFNDGLIHLCKHLDYKPVNCLLCGDKFEDLDTIMEHFLKCHSHDKVCQDSNECEPLLYFINRDGQTEKWVEQFFQFQVSGEFDRIVNVDCAAYCCICKEMQRILYKRIPSRLTRNYQTTLSPPVEVVRQHLNLHINYRPYECYLCCKAGNQVRFASVGDTALKHLKTHGFSPIDSAFLKEFFHHKPILELENFVKNYLITEFYPYSNTIGYGNRTQTSKQPTSFTLNGFQNQKNYSRSPDDIVSKGLFNNNTNGSISPLLPPQPQPQPQPSPQLYDLKRFAGASYACYHCKLTIIGIQELVTHCKTIHPNLSISSYCLNNLNGSE
ncbi:uncharacterized protein LOC128398123 [Panonychus citri]|nr:uncharacterized protein LOC128390405 [Panonychus citri]XP_053206090.1 uncharacterized protein LOC128390405 [Panonychus citri]XP_053214919.1 uncharacterized protein LOC128398123 [Panonychus citri]XP_053214920.1 uncharacterized protein LOC128398123 [Panonychus citri]